MSLLQEQNEKLPENWVKKESKSRPGVSYFFNIKTGESLWHSPVKTEILKIEEKIIRNVGKKLDLNERLKSAANSVPAPPKKDNLTSINSASSRVVKKNLAQKRLQDIQTKLAVERAAESKQIDLKAIKEKQSEASIYRVRDAQEILNKVKTVKENESKHEKVATIPLPKSPMPKKTLTVKKPENLPKLSTILEQNAKQTPFSAKKRKLSEIETPNLSRSVNERMTKIRGTDPKISPPKRPPQQTKPVVKVPEKPSIPSVSQKPKTSTEPVVADEKKGMISSLFNTLSSVANSVIKIFQDDKAEKQAETKTLANDRLNRQRESLASETFSLEDYDVIMEDLSHTAASFSANNTLYTTAREILDEPEEMDWEDIPEELALREVKDVREKCDLNNNKSVLLDTTIPRYKNTLTETKSAEKRFFIVIDTNVFLSHLKSIESLLENKFKYAGHPIIVVPYIVLQELDRIKDRRKYSDVAIAASQSIKYLNNKFKSKDHRIKGQSAIDATTKLIEISNPDDNIINCCLQINKEIVKESIGMILLSNDNNLRNKAFVNRIEAFSYSELMYEKDRLRLNGGGKT